MCNSCQLALRVAREWCAGSVIERIGGGGGEGAGPGKGGARAVGAVGGAVDPMDTRLVDLEVASVERGGAIDDALV